MLLLPGLKRNEKTLNRDSESESCREGCLWLRNLSSSRHTDREGDREINTLASFNLLPDLLPRVFMRQTQLESKGQERHWYSLYRWASQGRERAGWRMMVNRFGGADGRYHGILSVLVINPFNLGCITRLQNRLFAWVLPPNCGFVCVSTEPVLHQALFAVHKADTNSYPPWAYIVLVAISTRQ